MQSRYTSTAHSRDELHREFLSDIQRRLDALDRLLRHPKPLSAAEASRVARARYELLDLQEFWSRVEFIADDQRRVVHLNLDERKDVIQAE
jgi:hypothetical protein